MGNKGFLINTEKSLAENTLEFKLLRIEKLVKFREINFRPKFAKFAKVSSNEVI